MSWAAANWPWLLAAALGALVVVVGMSMVIVGKRSDGLDEHERGGI